MPKFDPRSLLKKSYFAFLLIILASVALDQATKIHAESTLQKFSHPTNTRIYQGNSVNVFELGGIAERKPGLAFGFTYVRNPGAAWSSFNNLGDRFQTPFFFCVTLIAIGFVLYMFRSIQPYRRVGRYALVLVMSGAIGNFLDRLRVGYVIDWIDVKWNVFGWYYDFPKFNVADACISVGIVFLLIDMFVHERAKAPETQKALS